MISVIDGVANTILPTIQVGTQPYGVGVNASTNRIYVANNLSNTVSVIDGATNTVLSTISVGNNPDGIGVNTSTSRIYVANYSSNTVSVIDGATNTVLSTISVGSGPEAVGVNASINRIYVTNAVSGTVSVIDGATNTVLSPISVGSWPNGIGVNASTNRIYVASSKTVTVIEDAASTASTTPTVTTDSATNVASNSATLNGTVNANGGTTTAWFEYGMTSGTYSNTTSTQTASGWSDTTISTDVSGLSSGTTYYYRAVAQNSEGAAYGSETSFTTLAPPEVVTGNASNITMISATLNGTVNANGMSTTAWFEYGSVSGAYSNTTAQKSVSGSSDTSVSVYVSGLSSGKTYYYRLVAENAAGTAYGSEKSFMTTSLTSPTPTPTSGTTPTPAVSPTPTPSTSGTGIVFGYVYDEDGNPLRSVTVEIEGGDYSDSVKTDADGYYEFDEVPPGDYTVTYTKTGYETQTQETTVEEGDDVELESVTMPTVQKGTIYGYVTDIRGNPLESVRLKLAGVGTKVKKMASTDSDGFFEFTDLEAGKYRIVATKRFYKAAQQTVDLEEGEDKEIEIEMKKTTKRGLLLTEEIQ